MTGMRFDGETYEPIHDQKRLTGQTLAVWRAMNDGQWHTLDGLCRITGYRSQASLSARLRDLRKDRFGGHDVEIRRRGDPTDGINEYRIAKPQEQQESFSEVTRLPLRRW
jgi:hypothetical protein